MATIRIPALLVLLAAFALGACANTVRGVGQDVRQTAQAVEDLG